MGGGGECWGPGGRTFVTPLRYTNCRQKWPASGYWKIPKKGSS